MNNKKVVSIGVQLDYKKELESMLADLRKQLDDIKNSSSDIELSKSLQSQIHAVEEEMSNLAKYVDNTFSKINEATVSTADFEKLQGQMSRLEGEFNKLRTSAELLNATFKDGESGIAIANRMSAEFSNMKKTAGSVIDTVTQLFSIITKAGAKPIINFQKFSFQDADDTLKELNRYLDNQKDYSRYKDNYDEASEKNLDDILKKEEEVEKKIGELRAQRKTSRDSGSPQDDPYIQYLDARIELMKKRRDDLIQVASDMYDELAKASDVSEKYLNRYNKAVDASVTDQSFDKEASKSVEAMQKTLNKASEEAKDKAAEVSSFVVKNGAINVPIKISSTPSGLSKEIKKALDAVQDSIKPIEVEVKLVSATAKGQHGKVTQKSAAEEINKETEELTSKFDEVAEGGELDLGKSFEKTYSTTLKAAQKMAEASISEIRRQLSENKIVIRPDIEVSDEVIAKVNNKIQKMISNSDMLKALETSLDEHLVDAFTGDSNKAKKKTKKKEKDLVDKFIYGHDSADGYSRLFDDNQFPEIKSVLNKTIDANIKNLSQKAFNTLLPQKKTYNVAEFENDVSKVVDDVFKDLLSARKKDSDEYLLNNKQRSSLASNKGLVSFLRKNITEKILSGYNVGIFGEDGKKPFAKSLTDALKKNSKFNEAMSDSISDIAFINSLRNVQYKQIESPKEQLNESTLNSVEIWRTGFISAIDAVASQLLSSLNASYRSAIETWESGMIAAVNNIANKTGQSIFDTQKKQGDKITEDKQNVEKPSKRVNNNTGKIVNEYVNKAVDVAFKDIIKSGPGQASHNKKMSKLKAPYKEFMTNTLNEMVPDIISARNTLEEKGVDAKTKKKVLGDIYKKIGSKSSDFLTDYNRKYEVNGKHKDFFTTEEFIDVNKQVSSYVRRNQENFLKRLFPDDFIEASKPEKDVKPEVEKTVEPIKEASSEIKATIDNTFPLKIDEGSFSNIVESLKEIQRLIGLAFDIPTMDQIESKWSEVDKAFKDIVADEKNLTKAGALKANKSNGLFGLLNEYYNMGGTRQINELSNISKIQSEKLQKDYGKYVSKHPLNDSSTGGLASTDIQAQLEQINSAAKELEPSIESLITLLGKLKEAMALSGDESAAQTGLNKIAEDLLNVTSALETLSPELIKNLRSFVNALGSKNLSEFKMPEGIKTFLNDLDALSSKAQELDNIATILKSVSKGKNIGDILNGQEQAGTTSKISESDYSAIYKDLIDERDKMLRNAGYDFVGDTDIQRLKNGVVEMTTVVRDANGAWKELKATVGSDFGINESAVKNLTEAQGLSRTGQKKATYDPSAKLNELSGLYSEVNNRAKQFAETRAKLDSQMFQLEDLNPKEVSNYERVLDLLIDIQTIEEELQRENVNIAATKGVGAKYATFHRNNIDDIKNNTDYNFFSGRMNTFATQVSDGQNAINSLIDSLRKIDGTDDLITKITQDFSHFVAEIVEGNIGAEEFNERWGKIVTKYKDFRGYYKGDVGRNANNKDIENELRRQMETFTQRSDIDFGKGLVSGKNGIDKLVGKFRDANNELKTFTAEIDRNTGAIRVYQSSTTQYVNGLDRFFTSLRAKLQEGLRYLLAYVSVRDIWRYLQQGVQVVREYDTALTEMRKVSDESVTSLKALQQQSFAWADEVGTTAIQLQNSIADFMRLGQQTEQAIESAKTANILMNVSEFESIGDATTALIAMEQAYQDLSATEIVDKLNNIGNNYAIATDELSVALQNSASALTTAGNTMDEAVAVITAGNLEVQDASKTGTGLQTIALRLTGTKEAKAQLEELGEETDDVITTQSKLRDTILNATKVSSNEFKGFDILGDDGQYKSTYEILLGIAEIWDEIKETDIKTGNLNRNLLLETLAGKRRANIAASILENPDILRSVYESSQDSAGSAAEELSKYLDSVEGKMQQFNNAIQQLSTDLINNELVKWFIDVGTAGVNALDAIAGKVSLVTTALSALTAIGLDKLGFQLVTFGKDSDTGRFGMTSNFLTQFAQRGISWDDATKDVYAKFEQFVDSTQGASKTKGWFADFVSQNGAVVEVSQFSDDIEKMANGFAQLSESEKKAQFQMADFTGGIAETRGLTSSLSDTFKQLGASILSGLASFGISLAINLAIQGIGMLIDKVHESRKEIAEAGKTAQAEFDKIGSGFEETKKSAEDAAKVYDELSHGVDTTTNTNRSLSTEEYQEYIEACNTIAELAPSFKTGVDTQGNAIVDFTGKVGGANAALKEFIEREERIAATSQNEEAYDIIKFGLQTQEDYKNEIEQLKTDASSYENFTEEGSGVTQQIAKQLESYIEGESSMIYVSAEQIKSLGSEWFSVRKSLMDFFRNNEIYFEDITPDPSGGFQVNLLPNDDLPENIIDAYNVAFAKTAQGVADAAGNASAQLGDKMAQSASDWENSIQAALTYVTSTDRYYNLSDNMQAAIKNAAYKNLKPEDFLDENGDRFSEEEVKEYMQRTYLNPITSAWNAQVIEDIGSGQAKKYQEALKSLFEIDSSLPANEYTDQVNKILDSLSGYFDAVDIDEKDFKAKFGLSFEIDLGFIDPDTGETKKVDNYADAIELLMKHRKFNYSDELREYVSKMTLEQQLDLTVALKDPMKLEAEISTLIRGAILEGVGTTSTYLTDYTTNKAKDTTEAYKNAVAAFTNEMSNVSTGVVDKDFARFIGGYNTGEDDSLQYLSESIDNVVDNAQKAKRYFTDDGLGLYSFAEEITEVASTLDNDLFKQAQRDALSNLFGDSVSANKIDKLVNGYQQWEAEKFNGADEESLEKIYDRLTNVVEGFSKDGLIDLLDKTDARFIKIKKDGTISFKRTDRAVDILSKTLNQSKEETDLLLTSLSQMGEININEIGFKSLQNDINIAKKNVEALTAALSEMGSQGYLSANTIGNLLAANSDYRDLLINAPGGTVVDANEIRHAVEEQTQAAYDFAEMQKNSFKTAAGENYNKMLEIVSANIVKEKDATEVLNSVLAGEHRWLKALGEENVSDIFDLASANSTLEGYIDNVEILQQELRGSVSAMTEYKNAQSTANLSDNYATIDSGQEAADKLYEQGWVGKDDFITYAAHLANYNEKEAEYVANYEKNRERLGKYFTEDVSGLALFLDDADRVSEYVSRIGDQFSIEIPDKIEEGVNAGRSGMSVFAESMQMTQETATDLLLALNDAGFDFKLIGMPDILREGLEEAVKAGNIDSYERWMGRVQEATKQGVEGVEDIVSDVSDTTARLMEDMGSDAQRIATEVSGGTNIIEGYYYTFDEAGNYLNKYSVSMVEATRNLEQLDSTSETYRDDLTKLSREFAALPEEEKVKLDIDGLSQQEIQNKIVTGELKANIPADLQLPEEIEQVDMTVAISQQSITDIYSAITAAINGMPLELNPSINTGNIESQVTSAVNSGFARATPVVPQNNVVAPVQTKAEVFFGADTSGYTSALSAISNTTTRANIGLNSSSFDSGLRRVNSSLSALGGRTISPSVTLGVSTFYAALNGVNAALDKLNGRNVVTTITTVRKVIGDPGNRASGSFILPWASGTFTPAHASGTDVSIDSDEDALINEVGQESIVRDGRFMLIPGGAHIEHLKKGDIVFSAKQTEELLRSGRVTSGGGHGKAYADGTFNAYLGGTGSGALKKKTSSSSGSKGSSKSSSGASSGNSSGNNGNSAADANDPEKFDWIEIRLQRLQDKIDNFDLKLQSVYSNWSDRNYALSRELVKTSDLMDNQAAAYNRYIKEANSVGLSAAYKKKVQNGTIDIEKISDENLRKKIDEYQQWYDKAMECKYAIDELKESYKELYKTQFENWDKYWQEQMDLIDAQEELYKYVRNGFSKTLTSVDKNVDNAVKKVADLTIAFNHAVQLGGIKKYSEAWYEMAQTIEEAKLAVYEYQSQAIEAINEEIDGLNKLNEARRNYYSSRGAFTGERSELVETIRNEVNRVNQLQARLLKDAETNGAQYITSAAYKERLAEIYEAMNGVTEAYKNLIALDKGYYDNLINLNNVYSDTVQKAYALDEAFGNYESVNKYAKQIESLRYNLGQAEAQAATMTQDLEDAVNSGAIKLGSTEWLQQKIAIQEVNNSILDYKKSIEDANQALINLKYEEMFERAIEKANAFIDKLETINELLTDEMMYDYNNGFLTESGMLSLILNDQSLDEHIENLKKFVKERQQIIDDYNNGEFGTESYEERMKEVESSINSELKAVQSSRNAILTIIKTQTKAELDALNKVIDARKEALKKKKDYWDYDKELKDKNKEIQLLKQQIQALQGVRINCPIHFNCWEPLRDIRTTTQG